MRIAVAGGTGLIGQHVVAALTAAGAEVVTISRSNGVDVVTGDGLEAAIGGVQRVVDVTNAGTMDEAAATKFFVSAAGQLQRVGQRAGADRLVVLSIAGVDRFAGGYYAAKLRHELAAQGGPIPTMVLRATEFHEFAGQVLDWGRQDDVAYVPEMRVQPAAARSVAEVLAELALAEPAPAALSEVGGPEVHELVDLATRLAAHRGDDVRVQGVRQDDPDSTAAASGALLPGLDARIVGPTFDTWLAAGEKAP